LAGQNIGRANIPPKVKIITGDALQVIPTLKGMFDFVFIDAEKSEYYQYLKLAEGKLQRGAVVFADNVGAFADQMGDYLDYVRASGKYKSRYVQVGKDGVEISVKL
jgi:predicted O-methyltransferase YrrM